MGVARAVEGASGTSSMSTAGPRTSMPFAMSAVRSAPTKNRVGLSTEAVSVDAAAPAGIEPPGGRRAPGRSGGRPASLFRFRSRELAITAEFAVLRPPR